MINPRELGLREAIKNKLISIQKSVQVYAKLSRMDKEIQKMSDKEVENMSKSVAAKVHKFCMKKKESGESLNPQMINEKVKQELENYES